MTLNADDRAHLAHDSYSVNRLAAHDPERRQRAVKTVQAAPRSQPVGQRADLARQRLPRREQRDERSAHQDHEIRVDLCHTIPVAAALAARLARPRDDAVVPSFAEHAQRARRLGGTERSTGAPGAPLAAARVVVGGAAVEVDRIANPAVVVRANIACRRDRFRRGALRAGPADAALKTEARNTRRLVERDDGPLQPVRVRHAAAEEPVRHAVDRHDVVRLPLK